MIHLSRLAVETGSQTGGQDRGLKPSWCSRQGVKTLVVDWLFLPQTFWARGGEPTTGLLTALCNVYGA